MKTSIGIVGGGVVGHATARAFMEMCDVKVYDVIPEKRTHSLKEVLNQELIFVCLPSPKKKYGCGCDTSIIEGFFEANKGSTALFVLKSTVPIGTTKKIYEGYNIPNIVHSPEFLTARCAVVDAQIPSRNIIGMPDRYKQNVEVIDSNTTINYPTINYPTQVCYRNLLRLYQQRFPGIQIFAMSSDESEAVKLIQNSFFATKIAFFNEMRSYCDAKGMNWDNVLGALLADGRIAHSHTQVPGPDGKYGFGGECLPKDLDNLIQCMFEVGNEYRILGSVQARNEIIDRKKS